MLIYHKAQPTKQSPSNSSFQLKNDLRIKGVFAFIDYLLKITCLTSVKAEKFFFY